MRFTKMTLYSHTNCSLRVEARFKSRGVNMEGLTIGEVARRVGVQTSAIRYYERIGLLPDPHRVNGVRRYGEDIFGKLGIIRLARRLGFGISEIYTLLHDFPADTPPSKRWGGLAPKKIDELDSPDK